MVPSYFITVVLSTTLSTGIFITLVNLLYYRELLDSYGRGAYDTSMDIKTHVRKKNVKTAQKILRKGRGAWGEFVNKALEQHENPYITASKTSSTKPLKILTTNTTSLPLFNQKER